MAVLDVRNLTMSFADKKLYEDASFQLEKHEHMGIVGQNGAGKSTTINHVIGLLRPFSGSIILNGQNLQENAAAYKRQIAYVPETPILYDELTLKEHLELTMLAYGLDRDLTWQKAHQLLKIFRLDNKLDWFPANFSKGMKQKVMIVSAFMTDAKLFIVDEPFYGLDPLAVHDLLNLIEKKKGQGAGILMSTHVLDTAQRYCDRFILLAHGQVKAHGTLKELQQKAAGAGETLDDIYLRLARDESDE